MLHEDPTAGAYVTLVSPPNDEERNAAAGFDTAEEEEEEEDDLDFSPQQSTSLLPVWFTESSKEFHWKWVPLPLRKAGRATARWIKGPNPPRQLLLTPLFPQWQALPAQWLEKFCPKRRHKIALLLLFYTAWLLPWFLVLLHSRSAGYIEGYGRPQTLTCGSTYWAFGNQCGLNGNGCRPFSKASMAFRCPANCGGTKLLEPHTIGNETVSYRPLVVGGPRPGQSSPAIYRADSFICQAAIHAGVITEAVGGCGVVRLEGANRDFAASKRNGIQSVGFPSTFPKSFSFVELSGSQATCPRDPRWPLLGVTLAAMVLLWIFSSSPPVLFFSTFVILMLHVGLVSDPPSYADLADLISVLVSRLLPASFVIYVLYRFCARPLLTPLSPPIYQFTKTVFYMPMAFMGALNNYTFAKLIPLERLTPLDIQQQPGAKLALALVVPTVVAIILSQAWQIRLAGLMPRYLKVYGIMAVTLLILLALPGLRLRVHHYILAILLMPGTALPTRPSLLYQGLLLGLFVNGVARWGFASIIETPAALGERAGGPDGAGGWWGATYPNITRDSVFISLPSYGSHETYRGNGNITFTLWERQRMAELGVDGITILINDVERYRGYLDEDKRGEFTWHRHGHRGLELRQPPELDVADSEPDEVADEDDEDDDDDAAPEDLFFRFAFLQGSQVGNYGGPGVWLRDGSWISPPLPP